MDVDALDRLNITQLRVICVQERIGHGYSKYGVGREDELRDLIRRVRPREKLTVESPPDPLVDILSRNFTLLRMQNIRVNRIVKMGEPIFNEICSKVTSTYSNACVTWIQELFLPEIEEEYQRNRETIIALRGEVEEKILFHGTTKMGIDSIIKTGFDPKFNKVAAYGKGTYFSTMAAYSKNYACRDSDGFSYMFLAQVLVGKTTNGKGPFDLDTSKYDNFVDNVKNPTIYVTPYLNGAIPRYIFAFYPNAK